MQALARSEDRLHVLLFIEDPELKDLRWERLCAPLDGARWDFLAREQRTPFSLYLPSQTDRRFPFVANVITRADADQVKVWDPVCAVGCPLGNDPVPTQGEVSSLKNELNGTNYWMINAPTYFGNSGGGIYRGTSHELVGVFSKIYTHGKTTPVVVPHMGLCTPITAVHEWLGREKLAFVLESTPQLDPQAQLATPGK